ncbi:MAG: TetR/AcrR family transcriptional regulator [Spirochaetota bacterium]
METNQPRTPQQDRSIATKQQLFQAALELFAEQGYHHTNTKKIAARAGIAVGSFYAYYRNKKEVFLEVIQYYYQRIQQTAFAGGLNPQGAEQLNIESVGRPTIESPGHPREFLADLLRKLYEAHDITPQLHREITGMRYSDPEVDKLISTAETATIYTIRKLLESMGPAIAVEDVEAAAQVVHRSAEEVIHSIKIFGTSIDPERLLAELQRMLERYLLGAGS